MERLVDMNVLDKERVRPNPMLDELCRLHMFILPKLFITIPILSSATTTLVLMHTEVVNHIW
jgi:hypothetical protein